MVVKYGAFPKGLAIVSGILAFYLAGIALVSHPFGFAGSAIVLLIWGVFLKLVAFGFEPQHFRTLRASPQEHSPSRGKDPDGRPDVSRIVRTATAPPPKPTDRILPGSGRDLVASARLTSQAHQPQDQAADKEARKEDQAWAEMFRVL